MEGTLHTLFYRIYFHQYIGLHSGAYEVSIKPGMRIGTSELYKLVPALMTLTFIQSHRVTRKFKLVQSFCLKVAWSSPNMCRC